MQRVRSNRNFRRGAAAVCLLLLGGACAGIRPPIVVPRTVSPPLPPDDPGRTGFFIQMADTQFGFFAQPLLFALWGIWWNQDSFERESWHFERAIAAANVLQPAFVVICGDLINQPGNAVQAAEFHRIRKQLDPRIPFYPVSGNHDVGNLPTPDSLRWYRENFGPSWYSFRQGDVFGIVLDSSIIYAPDAAEGAEAEQLAWLERELKAGRDSGARHILVFQHHPYFTERADEPDTYFNIPRERRATYLALFREAGVRAVLAGHYHRNATATDGRVQMITTGAVGRPLGEDPSGFRVVRPTATGLEHEYLGLGVP